jgi:polysaccharide pyruvyl transferase WcaK-like protein
MRDRPKFILEGIGGVYNYGCEAIVRGTVTILRRSWPDAKIVYRSYRAGHDRDVLRDVNARVADGTRRKSRMRRLAKRLRSRMVLSTQQNGRKYDWVKRADCVLSIGGDILTLWPNQEGAVEFPQARHIAQVLEKDRPVVLWGASVGPFDGNPHALAAFSAPLAKLSYVTARETLTQEYLIRLGVDAARIGLVADPAFMMSPAEDDPAVEKHAPRPGRTTLGVNLSPLSAQYVFGNTASDQVTARQAGALARMIEAFDVDLLLIPHVICPWRPEDDDSGYLEKVAEAMPARLAGRVRVLPAGLGARRTKAIVARCDALLAARMHCAIAGMDSAVPTLLVSYSPKAIGMCEYVYGHREMVLPLDADGHVLVDAVGRMLESRTSTRAHLGRRIPAVREDALRAGALLKEALSS